MDNTVATIYSALGIDWKKTVKNTPSGREYVYVDTVSLGGGADDGERRDRAAVRVSAVAQEQPRRHVEH